MKILLTHTAHMRDNYYGARALAGLQSLGEVVLHQGSDTLEGERLIAAARGCDLIVADRATALPAPIFDALPSLRAALRCAVDIRNIDVARCLAARHSCHARQTRLRRVGHGARARTSGRSQSRHLARCRRLSGGADTDGADGPAACRHHHRHHRLWRDRPRGSAAGGEPRHAGADFGPACHRTGVRTSARSICRPC